MTRLTSIFLNIVMMSQTVLAGPTPAPAIILPGALHGHYVFRVTAPTPGGVACTERWYFGSDGAFVVNSGEEVVTHHFHLEEREFANDISKQKTVHSWLITTEAVGNGKPDCFGRAHTYNHAARDEMILYRAADGGIVVSAPIGSSALRPFGVLEQAKTR
jgi:hypothetical protein